MSRDKQIREMAKDLENHTCMSEIEDIFEDIFEGRLEVVDKRSGDKLKKASEVAREIFAEIESCKWSETKYGDHMLCFEINSEKYAELKKKYESEETE